ncbi:hypothetical protein PsorP6_000264 [Peronosclerospora sorghi]|uniref:Uncharacterized protein n=1 Tax=Peronosclerospora sorghi TaxID=230839 RepID=A0ACC0WTE9_9STRA|nr:hypothetical protein PsorP6_000264 [Peronosclerospora sorghi]
MLYSSRKAALITPPGPSPTVASAASHPMTRGRSHTLRYRTKRDISFEGYLIKKSDVPMSWKATYFVLEEDTITFYETREDFISNTKLIDRSHFQAI